MSSTGITFEHLKAQLFNRPLLVDADRIAVMIDSIADRTGVAFDPALMDGGGVTAPRGAIYGLHGEWEVENHGIAPDIEVENDPASVAADHDPQLERAVQVTLEALKAHPVVIPGHPPYPDYQKK